jgi:amino acid transporter
MSIGSGIFASPGPVLARTGSALAALSVWLFGGVLVLLGSSCYAELGACIPGNGGEFIYLLRVFGTLPAFLFSWCNIVVARPATVAVIAVVFGEYAAKLLGSTSVLLMRGIAIILIWALTGVHCMSSVLGAAVQDVFTVLKLGSLLVIGFEGIKFLVAGEGGKNFDLGTVQMSSKNPGDYAIALYSALWAYDGWLVSKKIT